MGLDMYLTAKQFFWTKNHKTGRQNKEAQQIKKMFPEMKGSRLDYTIFEVGYWRKANAIHKWFVDNVQSGKDDCKGYYVSTKDLEKLKSVCEKILKIAIIKKGKIKNGYTFDDKGRKKYNYEYGEYIKNSEEIAELLPTEGGFFFGGTDYDKWYLDGIKNTIKIINKCLKLPDCWKFEYRSSW
jgi:hypothetical protein